MNNKHRTYILITLFIFICIFSFFSVITLLVDIPIREQSVNNFVYYDSDGFGVLKTDDGIRLGDRQESESPDRKEIGPLPEGKFISSYIFHGSEYIELPYQYKSYLYFDVPYYETRYRQVEFKYTRTLSIYDISDQISFFESEMSAYNRLLNEFESKLTTYDHWKFDPKVVKLPIVMSVSRNYYNNANMALSYRTKNQRGVNTIRSLFFSNKKAYVLEINSNNDTKFLANKFLGDITTFNLKTYNFSVLLNIILSTIAALVLVVLFIYVFTFRYRKLSIKNKDASKLYNYSLFMSILNMLIIIFIYYKILASGSNEYFYYDTRYVDLRVLAFLTAPTLFIMDLLLCTSLFVKARNEYQYDYLIQDWLRPYYRSRLNDQQERKTLILLLYYPLYMLGPMPLGVLCLLYIIPFSIIIFIMLEIRHLYRWINKDTNTIENESNCFMDYYVILDLKKEADKDEIEKAFNSAMAKYNSAGGNPLYGKQFYNEVQEAYAVLSSTNQLRPEYDKEYEAYKASNSTSYAYVNKQLESEIENIRNKLFNINTKRINRDVNMIALSFIILIVIAFSIITAIIGGGSNYSGHYSGGLSF